MFRPAGGLLRPAGGLLRMLGEKCTATVHFSPSIRDARAAHVTLGAKCRPRRRFAPSVTSS